eukprot:CAMPEP_0170453504 /NCGR_PEP_ID=MMETSP0123-20130129/2064_1 /TAXON_ID=182087 /ORGANISM="Favella ehrenbergii, Strain Fehren 1" /LENGTH=39 /DNA_ID= /DNA_START= /DNA_END= /DNA_ORIENTATION=
MTKIMKVRSPDDVTRITELESQLEATRAAKEQETGELRA